MFLFVYSCDSKKWALCFLDVVMAMLFVYVVTVACVNAGCAL